MGINGITNEKKAEEICLSWCSKGSKVALGLKHFFGFETEIDKKKAIEIFNEMIENDKDLKEEETKYAFFLLGRCYFKGDSTNKDLLKSIEYLNKAADLGVVNAIHGLGYINVNGCEDKEIETNIPKAIEYYEKSAELGHTDSIHNLALLYEEGQGVKKDLKRAVKYYERAMEYDYADSIDNLGLIYQNGDIEQGVKKDLLKAIKYFEKSASLNFANAYNNLAVIYEEGDEEFGIKSDIKKAIQLYEKSIELKSLRGLYNLGLVYEFGNEYEKIEKDFNKSCSLYYQRFCADQSSNANERLSNLIRENTNQIIWRTEYHTFWPKKNNLNQNIIFVLLISKHRKQLGNQTLNGVFLKGISFQIIQFLCHVSPKIK